MQKLKTQSEWIARGNGSHVWDEDRNEYIDYLLTLGLCCLATGNQK